MCGGEELKVWLCLAEFRSGSKEEIEGKVWRRWEDGSTCLVIVVPQSIREIT